VVGPGVWEAGSFGPLKPWGQRGLKVFGNLLSVALVNALDRLQISHLATLMNIYFSFM
jgi:hypothetical protein